MPNRTGRDPQVVGWDYAVSTVWIPKSGFEVAVCPANLHIVWNNCNEPQARLKLLHMRLIQLAFVDLLEIARVLLSHRYEREGNVLPF